MCKLETRILAISVEYFFYDVQGAGVGDISKFNHDQACVTSSPFDSKLRRQFQYSLFFRHKCQDDVQKGGKERRLSREFYFYRSLPHAAVNRAIFGRLDEKRGQLSGYGSLPEMSRSKKHGFLENSAFPTESYGQSQKAEGPQTRMKVD